MAASDVGRQVPVEIQQEALDAAVKVLARHDRTPFRRVLAELLHCKPTAAALRALAEKSPDRWAQALSIVAGLAGFDRGVGTTVNVYNVESMSDAELMQRMGELDKALAAKDITGEARRLDPEPVPVSTIDEKATSVRGSETAKPAAAINPLVSDIPY